MEVNIICPKCGNLTDLSTTSETFIYNIQCSACESQFTSYLAKVRAKRSRSYNKSGNRWFSVRVKHPDKTEALVEFRSDYYSDLELRQSDDVVFSYWKNRVCIIQNLTINKSYRVAAPDISILQVLFAIAFLALILIIFLAF